MKLMKPFANGLNGDVFDVVVLFEASEELAESIRSRMRMAQAVPGDHFVHLAFRDHTLRILKNFQVAPLDQEHRSELYSHELVDLGDVSFDDSEELQTGYELMIVTRDRCYWEFRPDNAFVTYETPCILRDDL